MMEYKHNLKVMTLTHSKLFVLASYDQHIKDFSELEYLWMDPQNMCLRRDLMIIMADVEQVLDEEITKYTDLRYTNLHEPIIVLVNHNTKKSKPDAFYYDIIRVDALRESLNLQNVIKSLESKSGIYYDLPFDELESFINL